MIKVLPTQMQVIKNILDRLIPNYEARAFGSRYKGNVKPYSDIDIAIVGDKELSNRLMAELREAFEESDLPFRVDILDWNAVSPEFRKVIEEGYEVI